MYLIGMILLKTNKSISADGKSCRKKFLHYFPKGFADKKYYDWERGYKWEAHLKWEEVLNENAFSQLIEEKKFEFIANAAIKIETKTNLLFSFEKMAIRDGVKDKGAAKDFALGLYNYVYGHEGIKDRFEAFADTLSGLPRKQTRVKTWPLQTVFGFIGKPSEHIFVKPTVTKRAAVRYNIEIPYASAPNFNTYKAVLDFAEHIRKDNKDLMPKDFIDLQSFIWVMGSDEYPD